MSGLKHTLLILIAIIFAYFWLVTPSLSYYSLQAFGVATLGFFIAKRFSKAQIWHILPETHSFEIAFISFATVLLVGSTGNANSLFYPFAYVHLFFLVMTTREKTAISATAATMLVHYALESEITLSNIATLLTLPLMLVFFLFARRQYDDARLQQKVAAADEKKLENVSQQEHSLESFISNFVEPKLLLLQDILETSIHRNKPIDPQIINTQITLLSSESQKILEQVKLKQNDNQEDENFEDINKQE